MKRAIATALVAMLVAGPTAAQPPPAPGSPEDRARALFIEGTTHFNIAEYDEAIAAYKEAYKLVPQPLLLYNIGQAYRQKNDCENARRFYRNYLRDAPDADHRAKVEQRIAEMDACMAAKPAPVVGTTTEPTTTEPTTTEPTTTEPTTTEPTTTEPHPPPVVPGPRDLGRPFRAIGIIAGAVGGVALGTGVYFSLRARGLASEIEDHCAKTCTSADVADHDRRGAAADRNATIAYISGAVVLAAGVGLYFYGRARHERPALAIVPIGGGGGGGGGAVVGGFRF